MLLMLKNKNKIPYILGFGIKSIIWGHPQLLSDKEFAFNGEVGLIPELGIFPGGGNGDPLQYFLPGKSHGRRNLAGYSL